MGSDPMTSRERVIKALRFDYPDRAPRDLWTLPGIPKYHRAALDRVLAQYPTDFAVPDFSYGPAKRARGTPAEVGTYVDEWGCVWEVGQPGVIGEVKAAPLDDWANLATYQPPWEVLESADFSRVNAGCATTDKFVLAGAGLARPFERAQFLRGTEKLMIDLAYGTREVRLLLELIHDYHMRELALWAKTDVDALGFMDDWGAQNQLLISPKMWRELFKPLYAEYCDLIHSAGKFVFMHSDGHIAAIYPDLIDIGVDALNSQLFCMDIEGLGRQYKGRITFWGEIDRQSLLPFGTPEDVKAGVRRVRRALDDGRGGVIAECEWGMDVPAENVAAVFDAWMEPLT
ncbi:MAG: methyltransferase [Anaerolineae bacterium]|nr:methyltransferase [Anaerolineae bacterium]